MTHRHVRRAPGPGAGAPRIPDSPEPSVLVTGEQLAHILRAAASVAHDDEVIVFGHSLQAVKVKLGYRRPRQQQG